MTRHSYRCLAFLQSGLKLWSKIRNHHVPRAWLSLLQIWLPPCASFMYALNLPSTLLHCSPLCLQRAAPLTQAPSLTYVPLHTYASVDLRRGLLDLGVSMAETVSSIITIAGLGLAIIEATIAYIKKVQLVDKIVERLLVKFKDLHRLIKLVEGIYRQGEAQEESKQAKLIRKNLVGCRDRLRNIHSMLYDLASKESTSFFQKVVLKRGVDKVKSDIDLAINDIQDYMKNIGMFISL